MSVPWLRRNSDGIPTSTEVPLDLVLNSSYKLVHQGFDGAGLIICPVIVGDGKIVLAYWGRMPVNELQMYVHRN